MANPVASPPPPPDLPAEGLRDVVDPWTIIPIREWILGILAALLILAAIAAAIWYFWRAARRRKAQGAAPPPPVPAHLRALRQLEAARQWLSDPDRFCTEVSRILRNYLEERFGWNAPDRTTEEFLRELSGTNELDNSLRELLGDFLIRCDLVKFARHDPTETELLQLHKAAANLVSDTAPRPEPPTPPGTGTAAPVSVSTPS